MKRLDALEVRNIVGRAHPVLVGEVSTVTTAFPHFARVLEPKHKLSEQIRALRLRYLVFGTYHLEYATGAVFYKLQVS